MRRREFVGAALSGVMVKPAWAAAAAGTAVEIDLGGQTYRYDGANGVDLGAYSDPLGQFVQDCYRVDHPQLPLTVFIRPDRGTDRLEVVFELGRLWTKAEPQNLPQYTARIIQGATSVVSLDVPVHYWFSRWRWQSAPRPVRGTAARLMEQWLMPQLSERLRPVTPPLRSAEKYTPMGLAGISPFMGMTGERPEIGLMTEPQAQYLCTGSQAALDTLLAQGEAAGTFPWNLRDEKTGGPLDVFAYPRATIYGPQAGNPYIARADTKISPDAAHQPALSYLPFLLTGDPYHLEQLQLIATWDVLWRPWDYRYRTTQIRGEAWCLRSWAQVAKVTPASVPKWMLPQAYWQKLLDSYRDWYMKTFVASSEPTRAIFRTTEQGFGGNEGGKMVAGTFDAPWQGEFLAAVLGWMVLMGHSQWRPIFEWRIGSTIARTNGQSGWPRSECTPYRMVMRATPNSPWVTDWKQCWDLTAAALDITVKDPDALDLTQLFYFPYTRGALVLAKHLDIPGAGPSLDWAEGELQRALAARKPFPYKWALV
jgi:hypothetical protein